MMAAQRFSQTHTLGDLLQGIPVSADFPVDVVIEGMGLDSRMVGIGDLFIALSGTCQHGISYLQQVIKKGCAAVLAEVDDNWSVEKIVTLEAEIPVIPIVGLDQLAGIIAARFHGFPASQLDVIGVTGTNGKSSCAWMLSHVLDGSGRCAMIGTLGNGFPGHLDVATHTTPDAISLQKMLSGFLEQGANAVAMEISSHALHQGRVAGLDVDVAVFTNLSRDHLDYHGTMEAYGEAKQRLFLNPALKSAVINGDDAFGKSLLANLPTAVRTILFSTRKTDVIADIHLLATAIRQLPEGLEIEIECGSERETLHSPLIGYFNAENLLAVVGAQMGLGRSFHEAVAALGSVLPVPGRMERFGGHGLPTVVVDYAHTPDALESALHASRAHVEGKLIVVFGCGGDRDRGKRPLMGAVAENHADETFITNDNPRSEEPQAIIDEILAGMVRPDLVHVEMDRTSAIWLAIAEARPGDIVLVAGKGHEDYQIIGEERRYFSDQDVVRKVLQEVKP